MLLWWTGCTNQSRRSVVESWGRVFCFCMTTLQPTPPELHRQLFCTAASRNSIIHRTRRNWRPVTIIYSNISRTRCVARDMRTTTRWSQQPNIGWSRGKKTFIWRAYRNCKRDGISALKLEETILKNENKIINLQLLHCTVPKNFLIFLIISLGETVPGEYTALY